LHKEGNKKKLVTNGDIETKTQEPTKEQITKSVSEPTVESSPEKTSILKSISGFFARLFGIS